MGIKQMRTAMVCVVCAVFAACATVSSTLNMRVQGKNVDLKKFLAEHPIADGQDIRNDVIARGPRSSVHMIQLRAGEKPHIHAKHRIRVVMIRGRGRIHIRDKNLRAVAGSVFEIGKGVPHYFELEGAGPAAAVVTFTPPFDGADIVPVGDK